MIVVENFRALALHLGFTVDPQEVRDVLHKTYGENGEVIRINFSKQSIEYPIAHGFKVNRADTCNFSSSENAVVLECVHRLLEKGYKPQHIELEPEWKLGHGGKSGRADILVRDQLGTALLIIECKTAGREFEKAWKDTLEDGAQLISYVEQEKATQFICLYASEFDAKAGQLKTSQHTISVKDNPQILLDQPKAQSFKAATNAKERFRVWKDTYRQEFTDVGIFEANIQPYQIGKSKYTFADDTRPLVATDIKGKYHDFRTILRKHNVSRRENAFEVLVNLFVCKIVDEMEHPDDLRFYWKGIAYDNYYDLVDRLQALYKTGMQRFLDQDIVYVSNADIDNAFWPVKKKRNAVKDEIKRLFRELKFFKGMDFEFIKVFNQTYFDRNAKILIEIIQMWQGYRLTGSSQNQFLGDMFEYFLDNGIKQSEGQFFTPVPICKFIVSSLPLEQLIANTSEPLKAIDYACGSGHFLTEYAAQLPALLQAQKQQANTSKWYESIYGIEKEDRLAKVAKVSAFMYSFNDIQILDADALVRHPNITEAGHDILVANPPFAVEDFLKTVPEDELERYTLLAHANDLGNKNVQCFFLERAKQLLKPGAVMGVIVPSSILSNTDGMHVATRQILLKYFDFVAITELGGSTFGKTGTNTVVLFMRRKSQRPEAEEHWTNRVKDYFEDWDAELKTGGGEYQDLDTLRQYCAHIGVAFDHYTSLLQGQPNAELLATEIFKDYRQAFDKATDTKKRIASKDFQKQSTESQQIELTQRFTQFCREREQNKLFYYLLAAHNPTPVLLVKGPSENNAQQQFLGYEWSGAKGQEGIRYIGGESVRDIATPLFDPKDRSNTSKISHVIRQAFAGEAVHIPSELQAYVAQAPLVDLLEFGRVEFDAVVSLMGKAKAFAISKWVLVRLGDIAEVLIGGTPSRNQHGFFTGNHLWVSIAEMDGNVITKTKERITDEAIKQSNVKLIPKGTTLLSFKLSIGKVAMAGADLYTNEAIAGLIPRNTEQVSNWYLFHLFGAKHIDLRTGNNAIGQSLNSKFLRDEVKIPLPPLNIQLQIVAECEAVDQGVDAAKAKIEQASQAITDGIARIYSEKHPQKRLEEICDIKRGRFSHRPRNDPAFFGGEYPFIQTGDVVRAIGSKVAYTQTLNEAGLGVSKLFNSPLVLITIAANIGDTAVLDYPACFADSVVGLTPINRDSVNLNVRFLELMMRAHKAHLNAIAPQVAQKNINVAILKPLRVPLPPLAEQLDFVAQIEKFEQAIAAAQATIDAAPALKQAVLQKYL